MLIFLTIPDKLLMIFNATDEILRIGVLRCGQLACALYRPAVGIIFSTLFQALGLGINSPIISLLRQIVILPPAAFMLSKVRLLDAVWYAFVIAEVVSLIASILIYRSVYKTRIKKPITSL